MRISDWSSDVCSSDLSYAALQDWDGILFYTFETKISGKWTPMIGDHLDMTLDPVKMAQLPAGAIIFMRGDVSEAKEVMTPPNSTDKTSEAPRMPRAAMPYYTPGFDMKLPPVHSPALQFPNTKTTPRAH